MSVYRKYPNFYTTDEDKKFDSFLNKTIIFSAKKYFSEKLTRESKELKIMDDDNYTEYLKEYTKYEDTSAYTKNIDQFIELCENQKLVSALKSLSDIEKTVIFLLFERQLKSSEASKILQICNDSVTRIKRRALQKLEKYMKGGNKSGK